MLSVVIPALNAEATLPATLDSVFAPAIADLDVVVVDGGSTDGTAPIAATRGARVIPSPPGRGRQLATGAQAARHNWLLFLHADTVLPHDWDTHINRFLAAARNIQRAGYFDLAFNTDVPGARRVARLANWRARTWGLPYGDQGLVIHRTLYDEVGGFDPRLNLMEDVELVRRLGPMRLKPLGAAVTTSARRYERHGWWKRPTRNLLCLGLYLAGAPAGWIERLYR